MPPLSRDPYPPLITDERPYPVLILSEDWIIRHANLPAVRLGLVPGMSVVSLLPAEEQLRHRACLRRSADTCYDPLQTPQNSAVFPVDGIPGCSLFYAEYVYTLKSAAIHAALFPGRREYLNAVTRSARGSASACQFLRRHTPSRSYGWHDLLEAQDAPAMDRRLTAATLALKCMNPSYYSEEPDVLFSLHQVLYIFQSEVLPHLYTADSLVRFSPLPAGEMFSRLEPDSFLLLLAALICGLDGLSENRVILAACSHCAETGELRFTTQCSRMSRIIHRSMDIHALTPAAPHRKHVWTLAEYIIGYSGYEIQLLGDAAAGTLTLLLRLPVCRQSFEFKSPQDEERILRQAALNARCAGLLFDAEQQQQDDDHIHGALMLRTEQKQ